MNDENEKQNKSWQDSLKEAIDKASKDLSRKDPPLFLDEFIRVSPEVHEACRKLVFSAHFRSRTTPEGSLRKI